MSPTAAPPTAPTGLRAIDDLIEGIEANPECHITSLKASRDRPYVNVEVLSNPHVEVPPGGDGKPPLEQMANGFLRRYEKLRQPFAESERHLVICRGAPTVGLPVDREETEAVPGAPIWEAALGRLAGEAEILAALGGEDDERAAVFSIQLTVGRDEAEQYRDRTLDEPFAYLAVLAWPGGPARGEPGARGLASGRLLRALTGSVAENTPLYALCVSEGEGEAGAFAHECERLRVSVALTGSGQETGLVTSSRAGLQPGQPPGSVAVTHCPSFRAGSPRSGMTRLRLDVWKGEAAIAFRRDLGSDRPATPVQVVSPLLSTSRVSSSERRLRSRVDRLIVAGRDKARGKREELERIGAFEDRVEELWEESGYVALCDDEGTVPLPVTRHTRYHLLLLVRERADGSGYDVMLSNHTPLRPSLLSDWNTLLLPAFKDVRALLEHLRDDVLRQAKERAEDVERVAHAEQFEDAVGRILDDEEKGHGDDLWAEELREVAARQIRKVSPTTGAVTEFDYHLVTLLPLVDRATAKADADGGDPKRRRELNDRRRIIQWLNGLDTVMPSGGPAPRSGLPLEALEGDGSGLRWDPAAGLTEDPGAKDRQRLRSVPPGAIWFPLGDGGERLWRLCPSICSRNADVMTWAERELDNARAGQPQLPDELVLGKYAGGADAYRFEDRIYPFDGEATEPDPAKPGLSTVEALRRVRFLEGYGLETEKAYEKAEIKRVFLRREEVAAAGAERHAIYIYEARAGEEFGPEVESRKLGILRPVQRYVLRAGLERAAEVNERVLTRLTEMGDPWGFLHVRKGAAPRSVAVTPPIVEQVWPGDLDDLSEEGQIEFVVCDGNHRIVQGVWKAPGTAMPAVAIVGEPNQPYYARPFGRLEWDATAENELSVTPDLASKYLARKVEEGDLDERGRGALANVSKAHWYRRYFRDLETGFGDMGGQGGRW